ncbi:MAG TPA: DUF4157 domain-containing protein [Longimicrobiales bacterium]|nr:DUF4157 domain-containing protein [Longimicrobiales bacterium]
MKTPDSHPKATSSKPVAVDIEERARRSRPADSPATQRFEDAIDGSPRIVAQRMRIEGTFGTPVQRVEEEEPLQGRFEAVQRVEEEEPLQGRFEAVQRVEEEELLQGRMAPGAAPLQARTDPSAGGPGGLPAGLRAGVEASSGVDLSNVRVHRESSEPAKVDALAFARGNDIHLASGQDRHLPHEAWHVVQQREGRVKPTLQLEDGVAVNDDPALEHEADVMGDRSARAGARLTPDERG